MGQLHWEPVGPARGRVVLLHGMMSLGATWWHIGPALAGDGWDVTALDLAGHGDSSSLDRPLTADALVDGVTARLSGSVDLLVGHSLGAATAATTVVRHPGLARAVVLEDPPGGLDAETEELAQGVEQDAEIARTDRDRLVRRSRAANPGWADEDVEQDVRGIEAADAAAVAAGLRGGLRGWDMPALAAAARVPVLVLAAPEARRENDDGHGSALTGAARAGVRAALPADRFVELPGGHCLHRDVPDRWLATVRAFADEVL